MTNTPYAYEPSTGELPQQIEAAPVDNVVSISGQPIPLPVIEPKPKRKYTRRKPIKARAKRKSSSAAAGAPIMDSALAKGVEPTAGENPTTSPEVVGSHLYRLQPGEILDHAARYQATVFSPQVRPEYDTPRRSTRWQRFAAPFSAFSNMAMPGGSDGRKYARPILTDTAPFGFVFIASILVAIVVLSVAIVRLVM